MATLNPQSNNVLKFGHGVSSGATAFRGISDAPRNFPQIDRLLDPFYAEDDTEEKYPLGYTVAFVLGSSLCLWALIVFSLIHLF
jgi:hypothetical protein